MASPSPGGRWAMQPPETAPAQSGKSAAAGSSSRMRTALSKACSFCARNSDRDAMSCAIDGGSGRLTAATPFVTLAAVVVVLVGAGLAASLVLEADEVSIKELAAVCSESEKPTDVTLVLVELVEPPLVVVLVVATVAGSKPISALTVVDVVADASEFSVS